MNNRAVSVADIMSTELTTVVPSTPLTQLLDVFAQHTFHHLPVVENDKLLGIISDRDLSQALSPNIGTESESAEDRRLLRQSAADIMTSTIIGIDRSTDLDTASILLLENDISCLPVTDDNGGLEGLLTWKDLLQYFVYSHG